MTPAQVASRCSRAGRESQGAQIHSHMHGSPVGAEAQLNAAATQIAAQKDITFAQAYSQALKANPSLYTQYLAEKSATVKPS